MNNLVNFKKIHDEVDKSTRSYGTKTPNEWNLQRLEVARKALAPPSLLVFSVVEALFESNYADRTWIVDGEADAFCVAAARKASSDHLSTVTIFTNDSDLIVYSSGPQTRVVMINQTRVRDNEDGKALEGFEFWPAALASMATPPLPDLIRPAFEMLSPLVSFKQALARSQSELNSSDYLTFFNTYDINFALHQLKHLKNHRRKGKVALQIDSRVSELICQAKAEASQMTEAEPDKVDGAYLDGVQAREASTACPHASSYPNGGETTTRVFQQLREAGRVRQTQESEIGTIECHEHSTPAESTPISLDMFLPVLLEDPSKATAWKIGAPFRYAAESLVLMTKGLTCSVFEYKRAGIRVSASEVKKESAERLYEHFTAWSEHMQRTLQTLTSLNHTDRWRMLIMQLTLRDMMREGMILPDAQDIVSILTGTAPTNWGLVHLSAQYQAEYYSVRMMKQVLGFVLEATSGSGESVNWLTCFAEQLQTFPKIARFFGLQQEREQSVSQMRWQILTDTFLQNMGVSTSPKKRSPERSRKGGKRRHESKEMMEVLEPKGKDHEQSLSNNPFGALAE